MVVVNGGANASFLAIPADVVDKHLATASGIYVKVLLAVMRKNGVDLKELSTWLGLPESDIAEAVQYWKANGILADQLSEKKAEKQSAPNRGIAEKARENEQIRFLLTAAEGVYKRPLTAMEQKSLVYYYEELKLPADVVVMAVEFCVSTGKGNINYLQKLCAGWAEQGVTTHERADEYIRRQMQRQSNEVKVQEIFGIRDRALTPANRKFITQWLEGYGFSQEMVKLAYERTVDAIGEVSFPYINKILETWFQNGISTPGDVERKDTKPSPKGGKGSPKTSYDLEEFERSKFYVPKPNER